MITAKTLASSSKGNAYLLESWGRWLLLECGIAFKELQRKLCFQISRLNGCLITHSHGDHSKAMVNLIRAGVDVYCTEETYVDAHGDPNHIYCQVTTGQKFHPGGHWNVQAFDTVHDARGSVGYVVSDGDDKLVFVTDSGYCRYTFPGMTMLMIEANYSEEILAANIEAGKIDPARMKRVRENHMSIERVCDLLRVNDLSRLREIRLLHLSDGNSDEAMFKRMVQRVAGVPVYVEGEK